MRARYIIGPDGGGIDVSDRGLAYGDGLFETMLVRAGKVQRLGAHLDRLLLGCQRLSLPAPDTIELTARINSAAGAIDDGNLKLLLTRGEGPRGYAPPPNPIPTIILLPASGKAATGGELKVATLDMRLGENVKLAGIKHLNRLEQVLARLELANLDADEGLMLSTSGAVIGATSRNLFAVFGETVKTPRIDRAGIAGVMRRCVLDRCVELGVEAVECDLTQESVSRADEIFMTNALVGIQSVTQLDRRRLASHAMADRLRESLEQHPEAVADG